MVNVFMESGTHSELVAILDSEEVYDELRPYFAKMARENRMIITETVDDIPIETLLDD